MRFPEEIKCTRQRCFLTQGDFAREVNDAFSTVNRWEAAIHRDCCSCRHIPVLFADKKHENTIGWVCDSSNHKLEQKKVLKLMNGAIEV